MSESDAANTHRARLATAVRRMADDFDQGVFVPLLEADVDGYLLHVLLDQGAYPASRLHQNARILGLGARRYDLVAGPVDVRPDGGERAAASLPQLIVQGKFFFRWGFTAQQQNVHLFHVLNDDIPTLEEARQIWPGATTCALVVDLHLTPGLRGYLSGMRNRRRRIDIIVERCHAVGASAIWVHPDNKGKTSVDVIEAKSQ
jgi:hypothetical protein